jgi:NAD(P)-dependent dehydrogenase (short-subunit alcohol dehydrogenase family)
VLTGFRRATVRAMSREPTLSGHRVLVIGGSAGIGLETARLVRAEGADVILTARNADRLYEAGRALGASIAAFDATDFGRLAGFFRELPGTIDHVLVTGPGPYYAPLQELDLDRARRDVDAHLLLAVEVARHAPGHVRPGGTLLFMGGTGGRHPAVGFAVISAMTAAMPALTKNLALELAPIRVNLIAAGRVVEPTDVAALAVHLMVNTAVTGATFDIDGGQQIVER